MKIKYYYLLSVLLLAFASCKTELPNVPSPVLNVNANTATVKAGTDVNFNISTDANIVTFYSGEPLMDYAMRSGHVVNISGAGLKMSFTSALAAGTQGAASATVPPQLSILESTNFTGVYDYATVKAATWTDITARFKYGINATFAASGNVDISDLVVTGKPLYIAYRYTTKPQTTNGDGRTWQMEAFTLTSNKDIGITGASIFPTITNQLSAGFQIIDQLPATAPSQSVITGTRVKLQANAYTSTNDPATETWAVTRGISTASLDLGGDLGIPIKDQAKSTPLTSYAYTYASPGTYTATFVGINANGKDEKESIQQIKITVTP